MKYLLAILAGMFVLGVTSPDPGPVTYAERTTASVSGTIVENAPAVKKSSSMSMAFCTAFVVKTDALETVLATARHCTADSFEIDPDIGPIITKLFPTHVTFMDGTELPIIGVLRDPSNDLAFLVAPPTFTQPVAFAPSIYRGEELFVFGAPGGASWSYSAAWSMRGSQFLDEGEPWRSVEQIDCPSCYGGDSGAAAFNMDGQAVGMVVAGHAGGAEATFIIPASIIQISLQGLVP